MQQMTDADKKEIKEIIREGFEAQNELWKAKFAPVENQVASHSQEVKKIPLLEQKIDNHITDHNKNDNNKKFSIEMWIIIGVFILQNIVYKFL